MRRILALTVTSLVGLAACGGGSDSSDPTTAPATDAPATTEAPAATTPPATEAPPATAPPATDAPPATAPPATDAPAATDAPQPPTDGVVAVSLVEWAIEAPVALPAGTVTFEVTNSGDFPHHLAIARGDSYETLPQIGGGAVDEDALGADFLGRTDNLQSGTSASIEFDLAPGNYVLFCNIATTVSHAAQGQVLSVTVGE